MTTLLCREFATLAKDEQGNVIAAGQEPGIKDSTIAAGGSLVLDESTQFVELYAVATDKRYRFNSATDDDAMIVSAGSTIFKGVYQVKGKSVTLFVTNAA